MNKLLIVCLPIAILLSTLSYAAETTVASTNMEKDACSLNSLDNENCINANNLKSVWRSTDKAYIANAQGWVDICLVKNGKITDTCDVVRGFGYPQDVIVRNKNSTYVAYVADANGNTYACPLDDTGKFQFNVCTNDGGALNATSYSGLQLHPNKQWLYSNNHANGTVNVCELNSDGSINTSSCKIAKSGLNTPGGRVAFFKTSEKLYAYFANNNQLSRCQVNAKEYTFENCQPELSGFLIALSASIYDNTLYFAFNSSASSAFVDICSIDVTTGAIDIASCVKSTGGGTFSFTSTVNMFVNGSWGYIPNGTSADISVCTQDDPSFTSCTLDTAP